jgi:hypothetical protein
MLLIMLSVSQHNVGTDSLAKVTLVSVERVIEIFDSMKVPFF